MTFKVYEEIARALAEAAIPLEVIAAQHRFKAYTELSPSLIAQIDRSIAAIRAALSVLDSPPEGRPDNGLGYGTAGPAAQGADAHAAVRALLEPHVRYSQGLQAKRREQHVDDLVRGVIAAVRRTPTATAEDD